MDTPEITTPEQDPKNEVLHEIFSSLYDEISTALGRCDETGKYTKIADEIQYIKHTIDTLWRNMVDNIAHDTYQKRMYYHKQLEECQQKLHNMQNNTYGDKALLSIIYPLVKEFDMTYDKLIRQYGKNFEDL